MLFPTIPPSSENPTQEPEEDLPPQTTPTGHEHYASAAVHCCNWVAAQDSDIAGAGDSDDDDSVVWKMDISGSHCCGQRRYMCIRIIIACDGGGD
jgi:hypothetical protein